MKILIVMSEINYMPANYNGLLEGLLTGQFESNQNHYQISGVAQLKTLDKRLLNPLIKMPFVGMFYMAGQILKNINAEKIHKARELLCARYRVPLLNWDSMNSLHAIEWVTSNEVDLILNIRTRCIYKKDILAAPRIGCLNIHHGLLPHFRGTFCDLYALFEYRAAGYSIHKMVRKIDDGEVYRVTEVHKRSKGEKIDYMEYLKKTVTREIEDLTGLLSEMAMTRKLPKPLEFSCKNTDISYTKNPSPKQIIQFIKQGIRL